MLLLPLHSFAMQCGWNFAACACAVAQDLDHLAGASHDQDSQEDGHAAQRYVDSAASDQHSAEHSASHHCVALPSTVMPPMATDIVRFATHDPGHFLPEPIPERLQRPPRVLA